MLRVRERIPTARGGGMEEPGSTRKGGGEGAEDVKGVRKERRGGEVKEAVARRRVR